MNETGLKITARYLCCILFTNVESEKLILKMKPLEQQRDVILGVKFSNLLLSFEKAMRCDSEKEFSVARKILVNYCVRNKTSLSSVTVK